MSGRVPLRLPPQRRPARADARLVGAWLHRPEGAAPLAQPPTLMSFVGADFMDRFFEGIRASGPAWTPSAWAPRVAYRDWAELPRATRDIGGPFKMYQTLQRRDPLIGELDLRDGEGDLRVALADERDGSSWIRKLYLPLHRHFALLSTELLCDAPGTPRIDPARVVEVGCVIRRLILDPGAERWEDWIAAPDGGGVWAELSGVDAEMRRDGAAVDPRALAPGQRYTDTTDPALRAILGVTNVTTALSLGVVPLAALPPGLGDSARHTAHYAVLPVMTREQERAPLPPADEKRARAALAEAAWSGLDRAFTPERCAQLKARAEALIPPLVEWARTWFPGLESLVSGGRAVRGADTLPERQTVTAETLWQMDVHARLAFGLYLLNGIARARAVLWEAIKPSPPPPPPPPPCPTGDELAAMLAAKGATRSPAPAGTHPTVWYMAFEIHTRALELEVLAADLARALEQGGAWMADELDTTATATAETLGEMAFGLDPRFDAGHLPDLGVDLSTPLARALLLEPGLFSLQADGRFHFDHGAMQSWFTDQAAAAPAAQAALRPPVPQPRFDPDHVYAARCFARVRGHHPCEPTQIVWSQRTEPYLIADPMDLLGTPPTALRLPDIPRIIADIPRMAKARALPMVAAHTPADSGFNTGKEAADTTRGLGVAWICSYGIPVFTICAWILFLIIFSILILIPGFAWMALLKFCIPVPTVKRA